jgi:hypothetical protein
MSEAELRSFAARVRPYFAAELRDIAEDLALEIARHVGIYAKLLRPDTPLDQILAWLRAADAPATLLEAARGRPPATFLALVESRAHDLRAA